MYCEKCGTERNDKGAFCAKCGTPYGKVPKGASIGKKGIIIIVAIVAALAILGTVLALVLGDGKKIDLTDYLIFSCEGYNGYAEPVVEFDEDTFFVYMAEEYGKDITDYLDKNTQDFLFGRVTLTDFLEDLVWCIDIGLSHTVCANGDKVVATVTVDDEDMQRALEDMGIQIEGGEKAWTVEGLRDATVVDLFENVKVDFFGLNEAAYIDLTLPKTVSGLAVEYTFDGAISMMKTDSDTQSEYRITHDAWRSVYEKGSTITITASYDKEAANALSLIVLETSKTYEVPELMPLSEHMKSITGSYKGTFTNRQFEDGEASHDVTLDIYTKNELMADTAKLTELAAAANAARGYEYESVETIQAALRQCGDYVAMFIYDYKGTACMYVMDVTYVTNTMSFSATTKDVLSSHSDVFSFHLVDLMIGTERIDGIVKGDFAWGNVGTIYLKKAQ